MKQTKNQLTAADKIILAGLLASVAGSVGGKYGKRLREIRARLG